MISIRIRTVHSIYHHKLKKAVYIHYSRRTTQFKHHNYVLCVSGHITPSGAPAICAKRADDSSKPGTFAEGCPYSFGHHIV